MNWWGPVLSEGHSSESAQTQHLPGLIFPETAASDLRLNIILKWWQMGLVTLAPVSLASCRRLSGPHQQTQPFCRLLSSSSLTSCLHCIRQLWLWVSYSDERDCGLRFFFIPADLIRCSLKQCRPTATWTPEVMEIVPKRPASALYIGSLPLLWLCQSPLYG